MVQHAKLQMSPACNTLRLARRQELRHLLALVLGLVHTCVHREQGKHPFQSSSSFRHLSSYLDVHHHIYTLQSKEPGWFLMDLDE